MNNNNNSNNRFGRGGPNNNQFGRGGQYGYGEPKEFDETVVQINRIAKKTKGGNQMRFSALLVVGDRKGRVGVGLAKAKDVRNAVRKATSAAKKHLINVPLRGTTVPFSVTEKFSAAKILLKPAPPGSGIIAGGPMRVVLDAAGIRDASGKILGTKNKISNVYATFKALESISEISERKTKEIKEMTVQLPKVVAKRAKRLGHGYGSGKGGHTFGVGLKDKKLEAT